MTPIGTQIGQRDAVTPTWSLFEEPWWLDCVAPGQWAAIEAKGDNGSVGRMPYVRRSGTVSRIIGPPLTPWLGPCIRVSEDNPGKKAGYEHEVLQELIGKLPAADIIDIGAAPEYGNLMAFHWAGYKLHLAYTYRLNLLVSESVLWEGLHQKTRSKIRKAQKELLIREDPEPSFILEASRKTFDRQGLPPLRVDGAVQSILRNAPESRRTLLSAWDTEGRMHAASLYVHDHRHCFYLMGGADPDLRSSNAQFVLMWEAIRRSIGVSAVFDFEGSMTEGIERFFRSFGAAQAPRYFARRSNLKGKLALYPYSVARRLLQGVQRNLSG